MNELQGHFEPVPPPANAPVDQIAETYGLCPGLRAEQHRSSYRCAHCHQMQPAGAMLVWVPDSVQMGDPLWSVIEQGRVNSFNGCGSGWCMSCAQRLCGKPSKKPAAKAHSVVKEPQRVAASKPSLWTRIRELLS